MKDSQNLGAVWARSRPGRGCLAALLLAVSPSLSAQDRTASGVFLPTEGEYEILWQRLEKSGKEGDWDAVIEGLTRFAGLARDPGANSVVPSGGGIALGVRRIFARVVAALPPEPRRRYQGRLDALLEEAWRESIEGADPAEHRLLRHRVLRDYRESRIFPLALEEEVDEAFEEGRWRDARSACEALLGQARDAGGADGGVSPGAAARARMYQAQISTILGDREGAALALEELRKLRSADLPDDLRSAIEAFLAAQPRAGSAVPPRAAPGGPAMKLSGLAPLESPLQPLVLPFPAAAQPGEDSYTLGTVVFERRVAGARLRPFLAERSRRALQGQVPLPYHAVARNGLIVFQHSDRVAAYDTRDNREAWSIALDPDAEDLGEMRAPLIGSSACYFVEAQSIHAVRRADGAPLWTKSISYDRTAKTLRQWAGPPPPPERLPGDAAPRDGGAEEPGAEAKEDEAGAREPGEAEPRREGKARGAKQKRTEAAAVSYALSPPTFHRSMIVLGVKVRIDQESLFYLTALDGAGKDVWTTYLGSAQGGNYLGLGGAATVPLAHAGTIYHLTNMGFIAAVDGEDGALLWIGEYPRLDARGRREAVRTENRWQPNPILPVLQDIVIAPQDSPYLLGVERTMGDITWRAPRESGSTLIGADGRACFIAGSDVIAVAHSGEERGRILWRAGTSAGQPGSASSQTPGRALFAWDAILLPTRSALLRISPSDGRLLSRTLWDFAGGGGNLLLTSNLLAVTNPEGFLLYGNRARELAWIGALPPDRTETLLERARSHFKNGEIEQGLEAARAWAESGPPAPPPNSTLDHIHLDLAHMLHELSRTPEAGPNVKELLRYRVKLERTPQRKVEAAIDLAEELERTGDRAGALAAFHQALAFDNPATEYSRDGSPRISSAAFLRDRIAALRRTLPDDDRTFARVDAAAREALRDARKRATPTSYLEVIRLYPYTQAAADAYLDLSVSFRDRQSYDQAIKALEGYLRDYPGGKELVKVKCQLANLLHASGLRREAKARYLDLLKEHPDAPIEGIQGSRREETVAEYVKPILREPMFQEISAAEPPDLRFPIRMSWRSPADLHAPGRAFLSPEGLAPEELKDCFITQSAEAIECRRLEDGLPLWRVALEMIPGIEMDDPPFGPRLARSGRRSLAGRYVNPHHPAGNPHHPAGNPHHTAGNPHHTAGGSLLVIHDDRNILAIDPRKGTVRWHVPIGSEKDAKTGQDILRQLRERLRGVVIADAGVFASTSRRRLHHLSLEGEMAWTADLEYEPAYHRPVVVGEEVFVHSLRPLGIRIHDRATGREVGRFEEKDGFSGRLVLAPVEIPGGRVLLPFEGKVSLVDLQERRVLWSFAPPRSTVDEMSWAPEWPEELIVVIKRPNNWPAVVAVSVKDGEELWRYEKFLAQRATFSVFRKENRIYLIHGDDNWRLLALEARLRPDGGKPIVEAIWPEEIELGTFYTGSGQRRLQAGADSVFVADPNNSISVYDRVTGGNRSASASAITSFLSDEKGSFAFAVMGGRFVILSDGGDCAFESVSPNERSLEPAEDMQLVREYQAKPGAVESTARLALHYFRAGDLESAITLLNRSLLGEDVLSRGGQANRFLLSYLLDGIKEEHMKESIPMTVARRFRTPPAIDGELNDAWDISTRIHLNAPRHVGVVPGPGELRDWEGEEDLSADVYLGWDDQYFYFCLDVSDDVLHPYDKDADNWKGDCLLIGLDPTNDGGYRQRGNDQLMTLALTVPKRNKLEKGKKDGEEGEEAEEEEDEARKPDGLFSVKKKEDDTGAIYEVALPWSTFQQGFEGSAPPEPGFTFGLSLLLTDDDTGQGATKTLSLNSCHLLPRSQKSAWVWRFIIPAFFPKVTLE